MLVQEQSTEAFVGQALVDLAASYGGVMVSIGHRLGLYRALAGQGRSARSSSLPGRDATSGTSANG